jgi:hypothetical protein
MLRLVDVFFIYFHLVLSLFNLSGWIWPRTRRLHLITISLTAFSWLGLGLIYGIGYCPLTDWHWQVREKLGDPPMPHSYIKFIVDDFTGLDVDAVIVDWVTGISFAVAFLLSIYVNFLRRPASA